MNKETLALTPAERMKRFWKLQQKCWALMSDEGREHFHRRNCRKRRVAGTEDSH
jgi:hypothetical protein